jgi:hypothetical protein
MHKDMDDNDFFQLAALMIERGYPVQTDNIKALAETLKKKYKGRVEQSLETTK